MHIALLLTTLTLVYADSTSLEYSSCSNNNNNTMSFRTRNPDKKVQ